MGIAAEIGGRVGEIVEEQLSGCNPEWVEVDDVYNYGDGQIAIVAYWDVPEDSLPNVLVAWDDAAATAADESRHAWFDESQQQDLATWLSMRWPATTGSEGFLRGGAWGGPL